MKITFANSAASATMEQNRSVSIVIPTYNRPNDVRALLSSILVQTKLPKEVIVVDDSNNSQTESLINAMRHAFLAKNVEVIHKKGGDASKKGICRARNLGLMQATGDFVFFIDDDVILDSHYIEEILNVYMCNHRAFGVQGDIGHPVFSIFSHAINKVFSLYYPERGKCRVLPTGGLTFPYSLSGITECEWISGTNSTYKKSVFDVFRWDEKLGEYSLYDDVDLSMKVLQQHHHSLYINPQAKFVHNVSATARRNLKLDTYIRIIYPIYFFHKNIKQTTYNRLLFIWSMVGRFFTLFFWRKKALQILYLLSAYVYAFKNLDEIVRGEFDFLRASKIAT